MTSKPQSLQRRPSSGTTSQSKKGTFGKLWSFIKGDYQKPPISEVARLLVVAKRQRTALEGSMSKLKHESEKVLKSGQILDALLDPKTTTEDYNKLLAEFNRLTNHSP